MVPDHSGGVWRVHKTAYGYSIKITGVKHKHPCAKRGEVTVCTIVPNRVIPADVALSNANLLAASPKLLAALKGLVRHNIAQDIRERVPHSVETETAAEAIALAEGLYP